MNPRTRTQQHPYTLYASPEDALTRVQATAEKSAWAVIQIHAEDNRVLWEIRDDRIVLWYRDPEQPERPDEGGQDGT